MWTHCTHSKEIASMLIDILYHRDSKSIAFTVADLLMKLSQYLVGKIFAKHTDNLIYNRPLSGLFLLQYIKAVFPGEVTCASPLLLHSEWW
jgi:hypothetical protein